ncbi:hypothetical protein DL95DRAFT_458494 [Leptodontidium sp. 2 PMI_412]|nr:hypothetical protein DL95DRAFT_458494 [Leptodontidium sp. 2 PMI_412]
MAQSWRRLAQDDSPESESAVGNGSSRRRRPTFSNKKISITAAITLIAIALLFSSHRLVADGYSFRKEPPQNTEEQSEAKPETPETTDFPPKPSTLLSTSKAAVIVENPPLENLVSIILHFSSVLGPEWPIHLFTSEGNIRAFPTRSSGWEVPCFFTKLWFWEQMAPAEHILMFQADSIICSNAPQKVEDFLMYDFVERHGDHSAGNVDYEDQWFSKKMREMPGGSNLPTPEVAMKFSVETTWYDKPLGYHQPNVWQKEHMDEIYKWCPEYGMCTLETFTDHNTENFGGS